MFKVLIKDKGEFKADSETELSSLLKANRGQLVKVYYEGSTTRMSSQTIQRIAKR